MKRLLTIAATAVIAAGSLAACGSDTKQPAGTVPPSSVMTGNTTAMTGNTTAMTPGTTAMTPGTTAMVPATSGG